MDPNMYYKMQHHAHDMQEDSYSSDDGNENESESIAKQPSDNTKHSKKMVNRYDQENSNYERIIRKRKRKSGDQLKILMREFDRNPNWSKETLLEVSRKTGLSEA